MHSLSFFLDHSTDIWGGGTNIPPFPYLHLLIIPFIPPMDMSRTNKYTYFMYKVPSNGKDSNCVVIFIGVVPGGYFDSERGGVGIVTWVIPRLGGRITGGHLIPILHLSMSGGHVHLFSTHWLPWKGILKNVTHFNTFDTSRYDISVLVPYSTYSYKQTCTTTCWQGQTI